MQVVNKQMLLYFDGEAKLVSKTAIVILQELELVKQHAMPVGGARQETPLPPEMVFGSFTSFPCRA